MAKLSEFLTDNSAIEQGELMEVGPVGNTFFIRTRGFTSEYRDYLYALQREAARQLNRGLKPGAQPYSQTTLPPSVDDRCQGKALAEKCVLDIEGLTDEHGKPVTLDRFKALLATGKNPALIMLAIAAAAKIGNDRAEDLEKTEKNSQKP